MTAMRPGETGGVVLLGWKTRDRALALLQQDCEFDPPLNDHDAEALWARYRERVNAVRGRPVRAPAPLAFTDDEQRLVADFLQDGSAFGIIGRGLFQDVMQDLAIIFSQLTEAAPA